MVKFLDEIDRFDLEQDIMNCWNVVEDLKTFSWSYIDKSSKMSEDDVLNYIMGLEKIYQVKFEKLFDTFERCIQNGKCL